MTTGRVRVKRSGALRCLTGLALAAAVLAGAACTGGGAPSGGSSSAVPASLPRSPAALPTFDLARFRDLLTQLRGRPVVVDVWASWCGPCIEQAPHIADVARRFGDRVQFVGVDSQDQLGPARAFIRRYGWTFPSVFDPRAEIMRGLGFLAQPITQIYLPDGRQDRRGFWASVFDEHELVSELDRVLSSG